MPMSETYWTVAQVCEYSYHVRCQLSFQSQFTKENSILPLKKNCSIIVAKIATHGYVILKCTFKAAK